MTDETFYVEAKSLSNFMSYVHCYPPFHWTIEIRLPSMVLRANEAAMSGNGQNCTPFDDSVIFATISTLDDYSRLSDQLVQIPHG